MSLFLLLLMLLMPYSVSRSLPCLGVLLKVDWWVIWFIFCYEKDIYYWVLYSPFFSVAFNVALCLFLFLFPPLFLSLLILSLSLSLLPLSPLPLSCWLSISFSVYLDIVRWLLDYYLCCINFIRNSSSPSWSSTSLIPQNRWNYYLLREIFSSNPILCSFS